MPQSTAPAALAAQLATLLADPAALRDLQQRQYDYAHTRFDVAVMVRSTLAFYREAAGLAPLSPPQPQPMAAHA